MLFIATSSPAVYFAIEELRSRFPQISWGDDPPAAILASVSAASVVLTTKPSPSAPTKVVIPAAATFGGGVWTQQWTERSMTPAEVGNTYGVARRDGFNGLLERRARSLEAAGDIVGAILERQKKV